VPSIPSQTFRAPYDSLAKVITASILVTLLVVVGVTHSVVVSILAVLLLVAAYAYSPTSYSISEGSIVVGRLIGNVRIPIDSIRAVRAATKDDFRGGIRLFGSGGLFGYYGVFLTSKLGRSTWYVTNRRNAVVVATGAKTVVLSPGDVDGFLAAIRPPFS